MATRTVTGTIYHLDHTAYASETVRFQLKQNIIVDEVVYPAEIKNVVTDAQGEFSINLAVPDSGTAHYVVYAASINEEFYLEAGSAVGLETLIDIPNVSEPPSALQVLLDAHNASFRHSVISVKAYGALGDGVTDDTAAIQAAFDELNEGLGNQEDPAYLLIEPAKYVVTGVLDLKNKYRAIVEGSGAVFTGNFSINASGSYMDIHNLYLHSTSANPAFVYGRNSSGSGGNIRLHNVQVFSDNAVAAVLWGQADSSLIENCEIYNAGSAPAIIMTSANETGLLDYASSTATFIRVVGGWIHGNGDTLVSMRGLLQNVIFDSVFFVPTLTSAIEIINGASVYELNLSNSRCEGFGNSVILKVASGGVSNGLVADNYAHALINADYIFDVDGTAWYWHLGIIMTSISSTKLLNNSGDIQYSMFVTNLDGKIVTTGTFDYCHVLAHSSTPITGTTGAHNYIIRLGMVEPVTQTISANFSTATNNILLLSAVTITHLARFMAYQRITVVFDGLSSVGGGYFLDIPAEPYTGAAGEIREFISMAPFYWTMIK